MRPLQLEAWALDVIERVTARQPIEDMRVELKARWPPGRRAARQIGGHANAARGESILWLIGLDEESGVAGAEAQELAEWYPQLVAEFDGIAPDLLQHLNVRAGDKTVVALLFATDRAPYVVKNPAYGQPGAGSISREVPWREGASTRSATREDIVRLVAPLEHRPEIEVLGARVGATRQAILAETAAPGQAREILGWRDLLDWMVRVQLYIVPRGDQVLVIPFHRSMATLTLPGYLPPTPLEKVSLAPPDNLGYRVRGGVSESLTVERSRYEVRVSGPGVVMLSAVAVTDMMPPGANQSTADLRVEMVAADATVPLRLSIVLQPEAHTRGGRAEGHIGSWVSGQPFL